MKTVFLTFFIFGLSSCLKKPKSLSSIVETTDLVKVWLDMGKKFIVPADSLFYEPTFLKLETTEDVLIGSVSQLIVVDGVGYLIVDNHVSNTIYLFDEKGKFKHTIAKQGSGPGEYIINRHIALSPDQKSVAIFDDRTATVHFYSIDGKFQESRKLKFSARAFEYIDDENFAFVGFANEEKKNCELFITDAEFNVKNMSFQSLYKENHFTYGVPNQIYRHNNKTYFYPNFSDTIFQVDADHIRANYFVEIEKYGRPKVDASTTNKMMREYPEKYLSFDGRFYCTNTSALFYIKTPAAMPMFMFLDKRNGIQYKWDYSYVNPYFAFLYGDMIMASNNNSYISVVNQSNIHGFKTTLYERLKKDKLDKTKADKLYENSKVDDNPVIVFYNVRHE